MHISFDVIILKLPTVTFTTYALHFDIFRKLKQIIRGYSC